MKKTDFKKTGFLLICLLASSAAYAQMEMPRELKTPDLKEETISLELKGMDVVEVLKMLAAKGNMNIIIGSTVQGKVTVLLKDVGVHEAFEVVLASNNLAVEKRGSVLYVLPQKDYEMLYGDRYGEEKETGIFRLKYAKPEEAGKAVDQIRTRIGKVIVDRDSSTLILVDTPRVVSQVSKLIRDLDRPPVSRVFELKYAPAKDLKEKLLDMLTKDVGTLRVDERTNKIIVTDSESRIEEIARMIQTFDEKSSQVLIDAKIIEITLDDAYKLGVDWQAVMKKAQKEFSIRNSFKLAAPGTLVPGSEIFFGDIGNSDLSAMIQALKTVGDANTLSNPRVATLNNQEAKILIGTSQPYATNSVTQGTSTTSTATSLTFLDIGVKLYVTPTINKDGFITMKLRPEVSAQSGDYTYGDPPTKVPVISTTHAETNVMVKDGATIMIAGLIKDERTSTVNEVPFLGKIPVLGLAFKNTSNEIKKKELVIFLTPHIISGDVDYLKVESEDPPSEKMFTVKEWPTFDRRAPVKTISGYLDAKRLRKEKGEIDVEGLTPEEYFQLVRNQILQAMSIPAEGKESLKKGDKAKVSFTIYAGGSLVTKPDIVESTSDVFGPEVARAVEKAAPFPPLPLSIKGTTKHFVMELIYEPK